MSPTNTSLSSLYQVSLPSLNPEASARALFKAINQLSEKDPVFREQVERHRGTYIVDAERGTIRLPFFEAELLADALRAAGLSPSLSVVREPKREERDRARASLIRGLGKK